jgi:hypothetical protein
MVSKDAPGPAIVRCFSIRNSPLVSTIVPRTSGAKVIVSPEAASAIATRSEPAPVSLVLVTVRVPWTFSAPATGAAATKSASPTRTVTVRINAALALARLNTGRYPNNCVKGQASSDARKAITRSVTHINNL